MSLISSLYIGQNGLSTSSQELGIIGDNIANAGTIGFKASRASFAELVGTNLVGGSGQEGMGTRLVAIQKILTQGAIATTGLSTDLAISGPGMFVVRTPEGTAYTRNGQFTLDEDGFFVDLQGNRVQGFSADAQGTVGGALGDLQPGNATSPPQATTSVTVRANLSADDAPTAAAFDINDPENTSNFSTATTVFDSLGNEHVVTTYYRKDPNGSWDWHAVTDGVGVGAGAGDVEIANGTLSFDSSGRLLDASQSLNNFTPVGAASPQLLNFDFGSPIGTGGTGEGISQVAGESTAKFLSQDGFGAGDLASVSIDDKGNVTGTFSNGQSRALGQVATADFPAADQLERAGNNLYRQTASSGDPAIGAPKSGGRGGLIAGALEQSNVDVATELVRMIVVQRGFQANSKTVSTADSLLAELIQLKR